MLVVPEGAPAEVTVRLPGGAALTCRPGTTPLIYAARSRAETYLADLISAGEVVTKAGGHIEGGPDIATPDGLAGTKESLFVLSLAELAVTGWSGIGTAKGKPLDFHAALLPRLLTIPAVAEAFRQQYLAMAGEAIAEGNA
jgi:hypothetical protein